MDLWSRKDRGGAGRGIPREKIIKLYFKTLIFFLPPLYNHYSMAGEEVSSLFS